MRICIGVLFAGSRSALNVYGSETLRQSFIFKKILYFRQLEGVEKASRRMRFLSWKPAAVRQLDKARAVKGSDGLFRKVRTNCIIL